MRNIKVLFFLITALLALSACQTVTTKIDKTTEQEKKELSQWLNKSESDLKSFFGQPDKVEFLKTRNRNYIYIAEKYKIKCERKFEINPKNMIVGFSSKNCF
ncbi:hypothetical protein N9N34_00190 [Candidatus Pelagibacter bacterium]|nr:hypothetical protein [Candidatus Pelagibacter bacterium]